MSKAYPWYTRATDIAHRLTIVGLVGFTFYMAGNVGWTIYQTGKQNERRLAIQKEMEAAKAQANIEEQPVTN
ncbi:Cytochrome c oxidase assembly protein [Komagataella phaffii CBS 7435]|uniref:Cytochrome c oxidase assembly protein n=2 Tax=Komagataella phaffii TaxID=460519 RepID=C4R933_KOMPG|nr:Hypothetical protein PAS_chr4_0838 [Komagataella phaffii GS115]CAH2450482.1 Cytochrome c oxidase assembly protein [Komagataella phaffii CBS 7435]CAY72108.1 Hypothetical protein PAS_chr4_0838 [Komagataella phaffii GS115]SCV12335.1 Cytochrome c oxidase assembly protein [Komagataella phaffii CBS 7435]